MMKRRTVGALATTLVVGALIAVAPAAAKGAGGVWGGASNSSTVTGPPGTYASNLRYAALAGGSTTTVLAIETAGGAIRNQRTIEGRWALPAVTSVDDAGGLSADGETIVLIRPTYGSRETRFRILDGRSLRLEDEFTLDGSFVFDAISPDGRVMYLVEYPRPNLITEYRVRAFDLATGELRPGTVVDPDEAGEPMTGDPVARAMSSDGRWAYTLYAAKEPFVHALDTEEATAVCIDLPQFENEKLYRFDLAVDSESGAITVLNRGDPAVVIDPETFEVGSPAASHSATDEGNVDGVIWMLIGGGLVLSVGVIAIQRRWRRGEAVGAGAR